jgi:hypothetical protein
VTTTAGGPTARAAEQENALRVYQTSSGWTINEQLRSGTVEPAIQKLVDQLDAALAATPSTEEHVVYHGSGVPIPPDAKEWSTPAFVSGTDSLDTAAFFADSLEVLRITVPKGTPSARLTDTGLEVPETETLLPRNAKLRITGRERGPAHTTIVSAVVDAPGVKRFDPRERRDNRGRWTDGGVGQGLADQQPVKSDVELRAALAAAEDNLARLRADVEAAVGKRFDPRQRRDPHTGEWTDGPGGTEALVVYAAQSFEFNEGLRTGEINDDDPRVRELDRLIAEGPQHRGTVFRATPRGAMVPTSATPGKVYRDQAYLSTTRDLNQTIDFAQDDRYDVLHIAGARGLDVAATLPPDYEMAPQEEVLLPRGTPLRVQRVRMDHDVDGNEVRHIYAQVDEGFDADAVMKLVAGLREADGRVPVAEGLSVERWGTIYRVFRGDKELFGSAVPKLVAQGIRREMEKHEGAKRFDPRQRRDPHTGEWSDGGGGGVAPDDVKKGGRFEFASGTEHGTGKHVENFRGTVAQKTSDGRLMVNAGTPKKPRWVVTRVDDARPIVRSQPVTRGDSKRKYRESLTPGEVKAIDSYMGENYKSINGTLRNGEGPSAVTGKRIAALDSAVRKGQLGRDTTLYRAAGFKQDWDALVDKTFTDHGFVSTSEATELPLMMSHRPNGAFIRIKAPAGAHVGYLHKLRNQQAVSKYDGVPEKEVLLPRDSTFKVTAAKRDREGVWHVDMELLAA